MKGRLPEFRRRVARIRNQAVFEIPEIFDRILREAAAGRAARSPVNGKKSPAALFQTSASSAGRERRDFRGLSG
jgi:hypothetical protein